MPSATGALGRASPESSAGAESEEYDVASDSPETAASESALAASSTWARCASQRVCASAYCFSQTSRCFS